MQGNLIRRVASVSIVTANLDATESFFVAAFDCRRQGRLRLSKDHATLLGLPGATITDSLLQLGDQDIHLLAFDPPGRPYPAGSTSTDLWFQHFAIIVSDMEAAYARLQAVGRFTPISEGGPVALPDSSGGVTAYKFRDTEGHPLELLAFLPGKAPPHWEAARTNGLFLGIDHSALSVSDTDASRLFFERCLGMTLGPGSQNEGPEQSRLDGLPAARVAVTALMPMSAPPHIELLGYAVGGRRPIDGATAANDIAATVLSLEANGLDHVLDKLSAMPGGVRWISKDPIALHDGRRAVVVLDPDGHRLLLIEQT